MSSRRLYISNFSGLANRLESLVLATMIEQRHGHRIHLDWPERNCLDIAGTQWGGIPLWRRIAAQKIRDFDASALETFGAHRNIVLRATYGPRDQQRDFLAVTAARLRPHPAIVAVIRATLATLAGRPVVGVHLRHGDFEVGEDCYDARAVRHPGVPLWWYEHVMERLLAAYPEVCFLLGYSGNPDALEHLRRRFPISVIPSPAAYRPLLPGHASEGHPVADLFGLACCSLMIATPTSSFSHWAANMLGPATRTLLPPPFMPRSAPACGVAGLAGQILLDWRAAAELGLGVVALAGNADFPVPTAADSSWLPG